MTDRSKEGDKARKGERGFDSINIKPALPRFPYWPVKLSPVGTMFSSSASSSSSEERTVKRSFVLWLHGRGDSGPANEPIKMYFTSPEFDNTRWCFPSAPNRPVTCARELHLPRFLGNHVSSFLFPICLYSVTRYELVDLLPGRRIGF